MPLKRCPECGHEISVTATTCPACGATLKRKIGCFSLIVILFLAGSIASATRSCSPTNIKRVPLKEKISPSNYIKSINAVKKMKCKNVGIDTVEDYFNIKSRPLNVQRGKWDAKLIDGIVLVSKTLTLLRKNKRGIRYEYRWLVYKTGTIVPQNDRAKKISWIR